MYSKIVLVITFKKQSEDPPYLRFREEYNKAESENQKMIEAISVSSYSKSESIVDSRYVNLKIIDDKDFIFFLIMTRLNRSNLCPITKFV